MRHLAAVGLLAAALACEREVTPAATAEPPAPDSRLTADLDVVRQARVFFAHMSLGANLLEGVARIPGSGLHVIALDPNVTSTLPGATFAHALFAADGDPDAKIRAFEKLLDAQLEPSPDVALMELSCADTDGSTDTKARFKIYREAIARLKVAHPQTAFVHVTSPLTVRDAGALDLLKRLTGISDGVAQANLRRDEYNGRLRAAFRGEPIFDLAALEALWPDGRPERFVRRGTSHPSLVPAYSTDGDRLTGVGLDRAARALIHTLAEALRGRASR